MRPKQHYFLGRGGMAFLSRWVPLYPKKTLHCLSEFSPPLHLDLSSRKDRDGLLQS